MNAQKLQAIKRIKKEFQDLSDNPNGNIGVTVGLVDENNIFEWRCTLIGPRDTPYVNGIFYLTIKFPQNYPEAPPEVCFKTPIYHVNINPKRTMRNGIRDESLGHVCISTLNWWKPHYTIKEVLTNIFGLFYMANPESPYGIDRAEELRNNKTLHDEKIKYFTKKYANHQIDQSVYENNENDWDFTYNP